jgi:hypothetical protein
MKPIDNAKIQRQFKIFLDLASPARLNKTLRNLLLAYALAQEDDAELTYTNNSVDLVYLFDLPDTIENEIKGNAPQDPT